MSVDRTPQQIADAVGASMRYSDVAIGLLNIKLASIGPGTAAMTMPVSAAMLNAASVCHGGLIFSLADSAMAFASCSHGPPTVSQHAAIDYIRPARAGDLLTATATEVSKSGRTGVYDVAVTNQRGELVAAFRGLTRNIKPAAASP
ncbi:MAG: hydroxyphenylacetyl-CoA thioesterase PaaI [Alphaproteobacteria bacterium]